MRHIIGVMWFQQMHANWQRALSAQRQLLDVLESQLAAEPTLVPSANNVMAAFQTDPQNIRVIIVGQDPYPTPNLATGIAFAVAANASIPQSLKNIFTELQTDAGGHPDRTLGGWQRQGVWLINRHLTTLHGMPAAHAKAGWQEFTDAAIAHVIQTGKHPIVVILWGKHAQGIAKTVNLQPANRQILVHKSVHPSPLSAYRGFFGSQPFSKANEWLRTHGQQPIDWTC